MSSTANKIKSLRLPPMPSLSDLVKLYKLSAIKKLSQNFLLDRNINNKIIRASGIKNDAFVMEIGPGPGGLTRSAIEQGAKQIVVIEKDLRFMNGLQMLADSASPQTKIEIFHGDALKFPFGNHINKSYKVDWNDELPNACIIGNLPFSIATPLLFKMLYKVSTRSSLFEIGRVPMTLMFQLEFGERMICPPGFKERSRVYKQSKLNWSVMSQAYCDVDIKFTVPSTAFVPAPKVHAAVVKLVPLKQPRLNCEFELVEKVVKYLFQFKNKKWPLGIYNLYPENLPELRSKFDSLCKVNKEKLPTQLDMLEIDDICMAHAEILAHFPEIKHFDFRK